MTQPITCSGCGRLNASTLAKCPRCGVRPDGSTAPKKGDHPGSVSLKTFLIVAAVLALIAALSGGLSSLHGNGGGSDTSALDQRTCEIFRDIARNVDIQTLDETRSRLADLYNGYGQSTTAGIQSGLRLMLEGMTAGDYGTASVGITQTSTACQAEGY